MQCWQSGFSGSVDRSGLVATRTAGCVHAAYRRLKCWELPHIPEHEHRRPGLAALGALPVWGADPASQSAWRVSGRVRARFAAGTEPSQSTWRVSGRLGARFAAGTEPSSDSTRPKASIAVGLFEGSLSSNTSQANASLSLTLRLSKWREAPPLVKRWMRPNTRVSVSPTEEEKPFRHKKGNPDKNSAKQQPADQMSPFSMYCSPLRTSGGWYYRADHRASPTTSVCAAGWQPSRFAKP